MPDVPQEPDAILAEGKLRAKFQKGRLGKLREDLETHAKTDSAGVALCQGVESAFLAVLEAMDDHRISPNEQEPS